jgi:hypothetical protein
LAYLHASGSHLLDHPKQPQFLLPALPGNFHLPHLDAGSDSDLLGLTFHFLFCPRYRQCWCSQGGDSKLTLIDSKFTFYRLGKI